MDVFSMRIFLILMILCSVPAFAAKKSKAFIDTSLYDGFIEKDFPFINSALDLGQAPSGFPQGNYTPRGILIQLAKGTWACFDRDLLRVSAIWHGGDFELKTMPQISYPGTGSKSGSFPRIKGELDFASGVYPGISLTKSFKDPRKAPLGQLPKGQGEWKGLHLTGKQLVLSYSISNTDVRESLSVLNKSVYCRTLKFDKISKALNFVLFQKSGLKSLKKSGQIYEVKDGKGSVGVYVSNGSISLSADGKVVCTTNAADCDIRFSKDIKALKGSLVSKRGVQDVKSGSFSRWPQTIKTKAILSTKKDAYVIDEIKLPLKNPWRRSVRFAALDFFSNGRAAAVTFDGDVWLIAGLKGHLENITWKRFASGIYSPLSLKIHKDKIYVFGRDQITRLHDLNKDGEADFYENYSSAFIQAMNTRDFSMDMVFDNKGDVFIAKGGIQNMGGKLKNKEFYFSKHAGSVIRIFNDGKSSEMYADGLREPFLGYNPKTNNLLATDQQGHYVPATPIISVEKGGYYGHGPSNYRKKETQAPLTWIPHKVDNSAAGITYNGSSKMGPLNNKMVLHSYGTMSSFMIYEGIGFGGVSPLTGVSDFPLLKGAVNPVDGQMYVTGFKIYSSKSKSLSGLSRLRYTGKPISNPTVLDVYKEGVLLTFDTPINKAELVKLSNYTIKRWNYKRTSKYGSGHYRLDKKAGEESLKPLKIISSSDLKSVFIAIPGMSLIEQMAIEYKLKSGDHIKESAVYFSVTAFKGLTPNKFAFKGIQGLDLKTAIEKRSKNLKASVSLGKTLLTKNACIGCHSLDGSKLGKIGPTFKGFYGSLRHFNKAKSQKADEAFIKESLIEPNKKVAKGFQVAMGSYAGILNDVEIKSVIMYLKQLK
jgi:cytochrome c2